MAQAYRRFEMRDCLLVGRARDGLFAGLVPAVDGRLCQAGGLGMLRQDLGRRIVALLQDVKQPSVKSLASTSSTGSHTRRRGPARA